MNNVLALYEHIIKVLEIYRHSGNDICKKYDGNTISNTLLRDSFTKPHNKCTTCCKCYDDHRNRRETCFCDETFSVETDCKSDTLDNSKKNRNNSCNSCHFLTTIVAIFLHFFKCRNCNCKKLHND